MGGEEGRRGGRARVFNLAVEPAVGGQRELEGQPVDVCREVAGGRGGGVGGRRVANVLAKISYKVQSPVFHI